MPVISKYGEQKVAREIPNQAMVQDLPAEAFGANAAAQALGSMANLADTIGQKKDEAATREALVNFEREKNDLFFNPDKGYFNTQGRNAYDMAPEVSKRLQDLKKKYLENLESDRARQAFSKAADSHITQAYASIERHASSGLKAWDIATHKSQLENALSNGELYWNDDKERAVNFTLGEQQVIEMGRKQGLDEETINTNLKKYRSNFARMAIAGALTHGTSEDAEKLYEQYKSHGMITGADDIKITNEIARKRKAEHTTDTIKVTTKFANEIVNKGYELGLDAMLKLVQENVPLELQSKVRKQVREMYNMRKEADRQHQLEIFNEAQEAIQSGQVTPEQWIAARAEEFDKLSPAQKRQIESGKFTATNPEVLTWINSLPLDQLVKLDLNKFTNDLSLEDRKKIAKRIEDARQGKFDTYIKTVSSIIRSKVEISGLKGEEKIKAYEYMNELFHQATNIKGRKLTPTEVQQIANEALKTFVVHGLFFDTKITLKDLHGNAKESFALNKVADELGRTHSGNKIVYNAYERLKDEGVEVNYNTLKAAVSLELRHRSQQK